MRAILIAITITGLLAGLAEATPAQSLAKRKVKAKRDASKAAQATQATAPQTQAQSAAGTASSAPQQGSASTPARPRPAPTPVVVKPIDPALAKSNLSRANKPPSSRFFSRLRSDSSRDAAKLKKLQAEQLNPAAAEPKVKHESYRKTWGPRSRNRRK